MQPNPNQPIRLLPHSVFFYFFWTLSSSGACTSEDVNQHQAFPAERFIIIAKQIQSQWVSAGFLSRQDCPISSKLYELLIIFFYFNTRTHDGPKSKYIPNTLSSTNFFFYFLRLLAIWSPWCHYSLYVSWGLVCLSPAPDVLYMFTSARSSLSCHLPTVYTHRIFIPLQRTSGAVDTFWKGVNCCSFELNNNFLPPCPHLLMDIIPP